MVGLSSPITGLRPLIARAYIASALLRSKPAASCTPQSFAAEILTCSSSWVMQGLGARFNSAINSRQVVRRRPAALRPPLAALPHSGEGGAGDSGGVVGGLLRPRTGAGEPFLHATR